MSRNSPAPEASVGGGVAPGRRGRSQNKAHVQFVPMWCSWDAGGAGAWRLIPNDRTHRTEVRDDETGEVQGYYEWKGYLREADAPAETIPALIEMAKSAKSYALSMQIDVPLWASDVLRRHGDDSSAGKPASKSY